MWVQEPGFLDTAPQKSLPEKIYIQLKCRLLIQFTERYLFLFIPSLSAIWIYQKYLDIRLMGLICQSGGVSEGFDPV
jgi:hypothetical protein